MRLCHCACCVTVHAGLPLRELRRHYRLTVCRYSVVLFAGVAAEALVYGEAEGGESDENLFKALVGELQPPWPPAKVRSTVVYHAAVQ